MQHTGAFRSSIVLGALVALVLGSACRRSAGSTTLSPQIWAVVDGHEIRQDDVEQVYRATVQPANPPPPDSEILNVKMGILGELIDQEILLARARTLGVEATDTELENAFAERKRCTPDEAFQQELAQRSLTVDDIKRGMRRELSAQKVIEREILSKITITDQEIADFYNQNRAQFNVAEPQYRVSQIVITPSRDAQLRNRLNDDAADPAAARRKLDMLVQRLRSGGDFASLAMDYSEDPESAPNGVDLGFISVSQLKQAPPELRDTVMKTQPGGVSTVTVGNTYRILMVTGHEPAGQRELNTPAVRDGIRDVLRDRRAQLLRAAYLIAARNDAQVVNNLARLVVDAQGKIPPSTVTPAKP